MPSVTGASVLPPGGRRGGLQALQDAVKWGLLERNVADQVDPPSDASVSADRRRAMRVWTPDQLGDFLEASACHWLFPMWLLAATTGLRRGELTGLVEYSLDLAALVLVVSWQLVPEEGPDRPNPTRPIHKQVTRTAASSRTVNLDIHTTNEVAAWVDRQRTQRDDLRVDDRHLVALEACAMSHRQERPQTVPLRLA